MITKYENIPKITVVIYVPLLRIAPGLSLPALTIIPTRIIPIIDAIIPAAESINGNKIPLI